jgi:DNA-3-methyladenine glycosylase II
LTEITFELRPAAPFRLDLTVWTLRRRRGNEIDTWDGRFYRRIFFVGRTPILTSVRQIGPIDKPRLTVTATAAQAIKRQQEELATVLERTLGLRLDLRGLYAMAEKDAKIRDLAHRFIGFRPPRFPSLFEAIVNAIACQQLSLTVGIILLNRLARAHATGSSAGQAPLAFPLPEQVAKLHPEQLGELGFSRQQAQALIAIANRLSDCSDHLNNLDQLEDESAVKELLQLRGIGRWSAEYIMLRGLGRLRVFPADDVAGQRNLHRWLRLRKGPRYEDVRRLLARWHPYQGLLYFHFLLANLEARGEVKQQDGQPAIAATD